MPIDNAALAESQPQVYFARTTTTNIPKGQQPNGTATSGNADKALSVPAFYSGCRFISETLASLPKGVYQKSGKGRQRVDHYIAPLLASYPNDLVTAAYLWETAIAHAVMYGNGYLWVERDTAGRVAGLYNLHSLLVRPVRVQGRQWYVFSPAEKGSKPIPFDYESVIHIRNFSEDGERGISVIDQLADTLGLARQYDEFLDAYFEQGAAINLVVEATGKLDKSDIDTLRYGIEQNHAGLSNAHKAMVLSNATAKNLTSPLKDFAFEVLKSASIDDIARVLRIPPTTLYALGRATWGNLEQLGTELVKFSLAPWVQKVELECNRKLFSQSERASGLYTKWNLDGLQRGDYATRIAAEVQQVNNRLLSPNEARELEDREPYDGGDSYFGPLNTPAVGSDQPEQQPATQPQPQQPPAAMPMQPMPMQPQMTGYLIDAAAGVCCKLAEGLLTDIAALELLAAAGLSRPSAEAMVASIASPTPQNAQQAPQQPTQAPQASVAAQGLKERYGRFLAAAAKRVASKQAKAFENHTRDGVVDGEWAERFATEQGIYLGECLAPFVETVVPDTTNQAFALQDICDGYTELVRKEGATADPNTVIEGIVTKIEKKQWNQPTTN